MLLFQQFSPGGPDGRVLLTGGDDAGVATASTEIFDPRTGRFEAGPTMTEPRAHHAATLLDPARLLVSGGSGDARHASRSTEVLDLATMHFHPVDAMQRARMRHAATRLADGSVFIFGGGMGAEQWSPASRRFAAVPVMARWPARYFATTTALPDGRVLLLGGADASGAAADEGIVWAGEVR